MKKLLVIILALTVICVAVPVSATGTEALTGDVNGDGSVDALDRMALARYIAGWQEYADINTDNADIDKNGTVTSKDRMILSRYLDSWDGYDAYFTQNAGTDVPIELPEDVFK